MEKVKIVRQKYLELIDHSNNHFKFYRMTELDNGKWVQQNGRIGNVGTARVFSNSIWYDKLNEKLSKGYVEKNDTYINHVNEGLAKHGFILDDGGSEQPVEVDMEKYARVKDKILKLIDDVTKATGDVDEKVNHLNDLNDILNGLVNENLLTTESINYMNKLIDKYNLAS